MSHLGCPGCKGKGHSLQKESPEWQVFKAVQPLFGSSLEWHFVPPHGQAIDNDELAINLRNAFDFFKSDMKSLIIIVPRELLSCKVFNSCLTTLHNLLEFLDSLVQESVFDVAHARHEVEDSIPMEDVVSSSMALVEKCCLDNTLSIGP
jgi:hypothetical protein